MRIKLISESDQLGLHVDDAREFLRLSANNPNENNLLIEAIQSGTNFLESLAWISITEKTYRLYFEKWPTKSIDLIKPPFNEIIEVKYIAAGASVYSTLADTNYEIDDSSYIPRLVWKTTANLPNLADSINAVYVEYKAGYSQQQLIPIKVKQVLKYFVAFMYDNREVNAPVDMKNIPFAMEVLVEQLRNIRFE